MAMFPTPEEVDTRIAYLRAHPEVRPPSNSYCRDCRLTGLLHCSEVEFCGGMVSFDQEPTPAEKALRAAQTPGDPKS